MGFLMQDIRISYELEHKKYSQVISFEEISQGTIEEHFELKGRVTKDLNVSHFRLIIKPKVVLQCLKIRSVVPYVYLRESKVYVNGFQSWTDSIELSLTEKMPRISPLAKPIIKKYALDSYGDYGFIKNSHNKGEFHGFTYSYIRNDDTYQLIGSLDESMGYTIIHHYGGNNEIHISKDLEGVTYQSGNDYLLVDLVIIEGKKEFCFDKYFELMKLKKPIVNRMSGWTSWYNYYEKITETIILKNLEAIYQKKYDLDIFQIDDGYETAIGDWLQIDAKKFPRGMKVVADVIHEKGYKAGIWLAPFICETNSRIFRDKKEWLLRDEAGKLVKAGNNWSSFYALDIYNPEVINYIKNVFDIVLNEWGYDMVKLDFLYAISLIPNHNKSRGQIMTEGMLLLRECVGDKIILGCGVPLGPSFGLVDYCRIGCDVGLDWNDSWVMQKLHRERISTYNAIKNSIYRQHLDGRAFLNDPDVFLLREDNIKLTLTEKKLLTFVNDLFGSLIFTSDDVSKYDDIQSEQCHYIMKGKQQCVHHIKEVKKDLIIVDFEENSIDYYAVINMSDKDEIYHKILVEKHGYIKEKK